MDLWAEIRRRSLAGELSLRAGRAPVPPQLPHRRRRSSTTPSRPATARPGRGPSPTSTPSCRHPPDPRGRQEGPEEAAAHRPAHLRAAPRRARLPRRPDRRQGGRRRLEAGPAPRSSCRWPTRPARPRCDFGQAEVIVAGRRHDGRPVRDDPAVLRRPLRLPVPARVHRGVPRGPRPGLRLLRRRARARISYDNIQDRRRQDHRRPRPRARPTSSSGCRATHLFEAHFCLVRRPNEKGHVETRVGYARRNFLVPVPAGRRWLEALNARLERRLPRRPDAAAAGQAGDQGRAARRGAGGVPAAAGRAVRGRAGSSRRRPTRCRWSASTPTTTRCRPRYAHQPADGHRARSTTVRIAAGDRVVADHRRCWGREQVIVRPGALPGPAGAQARRAGLRPRRWRAGSCRSASASCAAGWRPSSAGRGRGSSSRSCGCWSGASLAELTGAVERALELGVRRRRRGAADPGAPARASRSALFCLDGRPHLQARCGVPSARPVGLREPARRG